VRSLANLMERLSFFCLFLFVSSAELPSTHGDLKIFHGDIIEDRKSVFQAHLARIANEQDVTAVMQTLMSNGKIARATHNIMAYRCWDSQRNVQLADNDDDVSHNRFHQFVTLITRCLIH
jgi:hypothetical protein